MTLRILEFSTVTGVFLREKRDFLSEVCSSWVYGNVTTKECEVVLSYL